MKSIESQVGGQIMRIEVSEGSTITEGQTLLIVESMKMEIPLEADEGGTIKAILVQPGDAITEGQIVMEIE
ncbi:acetyl-CoA carboxylase biotin carboxyl carrier protein subunit [Pollutimonas subterranea]|uniref:Acetyl-CoA carboxylase biotin carboxyl carrier protein subunit n=1 Tax=Pollutimonas subterranea TaxID=2045210 RepID=A0A2N4U065_9BURK|nr:acetyl-CoA carboxylase biotin carboxyl carrier protein subunit [Pollutimonas subterranea]PLC48402.1 acetyl-CoA carboxylase biotin carboxyl carrier protein subunit [Pollutimonas subterranea]